MSILYIGSQTTNSFVITGDGTGNLVIQTGNTATTAVTIDTSQNATFAGKVASAGSLQLATNGTTTALTLDTSQNATFAGKVASASSLQLATNGTTTAVTIDTNQNVGIGVTPSAWGSSYKAVQMPYATMMNSSAGGYYGANFYYNSSGSPTYVNNGYALAYSAYSAGGAHLWLTAPSGTAGNAITFTQAMTLDANGRLLLNQTAVTSATSTASTFSLTAQSTGAAALAISGRSSDNLSDIYFLSNSGATQYANIEAGSTYLAFGTGGSERARIDSSGNFLVGRTAAVRGGIDAYFANTDGINSSSAQAGGSTRSLFTGWNSATASTSGTLAFNVTTNGNVTNINNSYGAISDAKLKENIIDATPKLEDLCKVKVRQYNLKSDPNHKQIGVVAQELEEVFAGLVEETVDRDQEGKPLETTTKSVKYSVFVPMLIKAIQELAAQVTTLQTQITALQAKG